MMRNSPRSETDGAERLSIPTIHKARDGAVVEHAGVMPVPQRYSVKTACDAVASGVTIMARSEHASEATLSGVNPTFRCGKDDLRPDMTLQQFKDINLTTSLKGELEAFCKYNDIDFETYIGGLTWSFWREIPGINLSVVQDSTVADRYWIIETGGGGIYLIQNGVIQHEMYSTQSRDRVRNQVRSVIEKYKAIQELFGNDMAWIVEMQLADKDDTLYFLQRHPTRNLESTKLWQFSEGPKDDEIVVKNEPPAIVRGTTPPEGVTGNMLFEGSVFLNRSSAHDIVCDVGIRFPIYQQVEVGAAKVFINTSVAYGGTMHDGHGMMIPFAKSEAFICAPDFEKQLAPRLKEKLRDVEKTKGDAAQAFRLSNLKAKLSKVINVDEYERRLDEYENNPENKVQLRLLVRSNGDEARIQVLDAF